METMRWLQANAELDQLLEQSLDERAGYLASLRRRDAALAADVEALLEEHHALDAAGLLTPSSADEATRTSVGDSGRRRDPLGAWPAPH